MSTTTLRLPNVPPSKSSNKSSNSLISPKATEYTRLSLALLFVALVLGTAYSVFFNTYLDTSNPLITHLPHPAQDTSYFARKSNVFNRVFVKRAWGWTVGVSVALGLTGRRQTSLGIAEAIRVLNLYPLSLSSFKATQADTLYPCLAPSSTGSQTPRTTRLWLWRITLATLVWAAFTSWFFGPGLFDRVGAYTGAECVVVVPFSPDYSALGEASVNPGIDGLIGGRENGVLLSIPIEYCHTRTTITPDAHAHLFMSPSIQSYGRSGLKDDLEEAWKEAVESWKGGHARLYKGHDVSGHIFLLTMCILFLTDQVVGVLYPLHIPSIMAGTMRRVRGPEAWAFRATLALLALWWWMAIMTSVYFHTPQEKLSGFLTGVAGYLITRIPLPTSEPAKIGVPIPDEKLRSDAMHLD